MKNKKNCNICYDWTSFAKIWHGDVPWSSTPPQHIKIYVLEKMHIVANCDLENITACTCTYFSTYFSRIFVCIIAFPSLSAIKCTVIDDKTANINDKKCSLSTVLSAVDQKLQNHKKVILLSIRWAVSPFYDFCSFWSVAVNTLHKLQFLSFTHGLAMIDLLAATSLDALMEHITAYKETLHNYWYQALLNYGTSVYTVFKNACISFTLVLFSILHIKLLKFK